MRVMISGGAGFIGCNLTRAFAERRHEVVVVDNLSRFGSEQNLRDMSDDGVIQKMITFRNIDVRDSQSFSRALIDGRGPFDAVVHLAAQTSVTKSLEDPLDDFDVNARGTLTVLEAVRRHAPSAHFVFASTNKVYGDLHSLRVERSASRYVLPDFPAGIPESIPTDAASPYGCSKLAADGYVRDFFRTYGMATTVLRMSCVYGQWQNGTVDQGWVSWFLHSALLGSELTIYGDGLQVRDLLHIDDLVEVYVRLITERKGIGETFNVGGGQAFSLSLWAEFGPLLEELLGRRVAVRYSSRRVADQNIYITDHGKLSAALEWRPRRTPREGIAELLDWMADRDRQQI